jgi:hypothetical protein
MKPLRAFASTVITVCLVLSLLGGALIAYAATDSASNTMGIRSSEIRAGGSGDDELLLDENGITPEQAIFNLIEAENAADWQKVYDDLSAYTAWCYEYVRADLASRAPQYSDFRILQTDFIQLDNSKYARVQVAYTLEYKDRATGEQKTMNRDSDWWTVFTEDGVWRVEYANGTPGFTLNADTPHDLDIVLDFEAQPSVHNIVRFAG